MKIAIRLIIAVLLTLFAYVLCSLVLGNLMGPGLVTQIIVGVSCVFVFLVVLFGKPSSGRGNFGGNDIGGPGPMNLD